MIDHNYLEKYVIGCMMNNQECSLKSLEMEDGYFSNPELRLMYRSIVELVNANKNVDPTELAILKFDDKLIMQCVNMAVTTVSFNEKFEQLKTIFYKKNALNKLLEIHEKLKNEEFDNSVELKSFLTSNMNFEVKENAQQKSLEDVFLNMLIELENNDKMRPMMYGIDKLDAMTQGLYKNELTIIAARPGMGKTAFGIQVSINLCQQGFKGLFISREMGDVQIMRRIIANRIKINSHKLKRLSTIGDNDFNKMLMCKDEFTKLPLLIDYKTSTIEDIKVLISEMKRQNKLDFVVIDYLQLLKTKKKCENKQYEVAEISRELSIMRQELDIPIICLSQLNRSVEQRTEKKPMLSDLRDSGAIEQDANNVLALYQTDEMAEKYLLDIIILKQRDGMTGDVTVKYYKPTNTIAN